MTEKKLDLTTPDSRGYVPDQKLLDTAWRHTGNNHVYNILGFVWNGEDDTWMLGFDMTFTRTPANFFGRRSDGSPRFTLV